MFGGWKKANALPSRIQAFDTNLAAIGALQADFPTLEAVSLEEAAGADLVFAALPALAMPDMLSAIAGKLKVDAVLCSLAPMVKLATLKETLGGFCRLARMNPNAPSIIGQGYNPIAFGDDLPAVARDQLLALLQPFGQSPAVDESRLESYAVISGMGPTYFGFQFAEMERLANSFGLDPEAARQAVRAMLHGTVDLLFASDLPEALALDLVPVRPMAAHEAEIAGMLQKELGAIYTKLTR